MNKNMKNLITIALMLLWMSSFAQTATLEAIGFTLNERDVIKKEHIDFSKEHILFVLYGEIEIDGHTFLNHKADKPIMYRANLDKVVLSDGENEYTHRGCELNGCKVIHLEKVSYTFTTSPNWWERPEYNPFWLNSGGVKYDSISIQTTNDLNKVKWHEN